MSKKITISCLQYTSLEDENETLKIINPLIENAASRKSDLIALPECSTFMCKNKINTMNQSKVEKDSISLSNIVKLARLYKVNILIGSLQTKLNNQNRLVNRSFLINSLGKIISRYDKIHMFDVKLENGQHFQESDTYKAGKKAIVSKLNIGDKKIYLGLSICYDLRFPNLYQDLANAGAEIISVPAAFTKVTGKAHWHTLLKARAIETGCFLIAPAQVGKHFDTRVSYGHSLMVTPWGKVIMDAKKTGPTVITANIDIDEVYKSRQMIPCIKNKREYKIKN